MELIATDATPLDMLEALDDAGGQVARRSRRAFGLQARQVEGGTSVTIRTPAGELVAIVGLYPDEANGAEAWLAAGPALKANLRGAMRIARQVLEYVGAQAAPLTATAYIHPSSVAGGRLAAWLGFDVAPMVETPLGRMRSWTRRFP